MRRILLTGLMGAIAYGAIAISLAAPAHAHRSCITIYVTSKVYKSKWYTGVDGRGHLLVWEWGTEDTGYDLFCI